MVGNKKLAKKLYECIPKGQKGLLMTCDTDDELKKRMEHVNNLLEEVDQFVYTSVNTVGTSYDKKGHFDYGLAYMSASGTTPRDMMQGLMRVRHLNTGDVYFSTYDTCLNKKARLCFDRDGIRCRLDKDISEEEGHRRGCGMICRGYPEWLKWVAITNQQEVNVSGYNHLGLVHLLFRECGYLILDEKDPLKQEELGKIAAQVKGGKIGLCDILQVVDDKEINEIRLRVERGEATAQDKVKMAIGSFHRMYSLRTMTADEVDISKAFEYCLMNKGDIEKKLSRVHPNWARDKVVLLDKTVVQWGYVKELCKKLGVADGYERATPIERGNVVSAGEYLESIAMELNEVFGLRIRAPTKGPGQGTVRRGVELSNGILRVWGLTALKTTKQMKRVEGKRVYVADFRLAFRESLSQYLTKFDGQWDVYRFVPDVGEEEDLVL